MAALEFRNEILDRIVAKIASARRASGDTVIVNGRAMVNAKVSRDGVRVNVLVGQDTPPGYSGSFGARMFDYDVSRRTVDDAERELAPWVYAYAGFGRA